MTLRSLRTTKIRSSFIDRYYRYREQISHALRVGDQENARELIRNARKMLDLVFVKEKELKVDRRGSKKEV